MSNLRNAKQAIRASGVHTSSAAAPVAVGFKQRPGAAAEPVAYSMEASSRQLKHAARIGYFHHLPGFHNCARTAAAHVGPVLARPG